ncbi:TipC family immunity protein [Streptococcus oricebi]|uniref:DUF4468 domain-containing protein n=1 Tax=Streptococcus oricebi TaxID=1547447 RepID=A0ABS5B0H3_9STRE|nr:TipC family immunity protein [Streptococcus oricebi]MBP2622333.1 hypothetical protein [Streptococcus oricebi]
MNKKFLIAAILLCIGLLCLVPFVFSNKNRKIDRGDIFGEIYAYEKANYPNPNPAFQRIQGLSSRSYRDSGEEFRTMAAESYSKNVIPKGYEHVGVSFSFRSKGTVLIAYDRKVAPNLSLYVYHKYSVEDKTLTQDISFVDEQNNRVRIRNKGEVKKLLTQYSITNEDIKKYNKEILNDFFLRDWCKAFDSAFTPNDWGDVKVVDKWDKS